MHHHRKGGGAVPIIGQQDIIFAIADLAGNVTAAGLGSGGGSKENIEAKQKYKEFHQRNSRKEFKSSALLGQPSEGEDGLINPRSGVEIVLEPEECEFHTKAPCGVGLVQDGEFNYELQNISHTEYEQ